MTSSESRMEERIRSIMVRGDQEEGLDLFFRTYSAEERPTPESVLGIFGELNRSGSNEEAFSFLTKVREWFKGNDEIQEALELSKRILFDSLIAKANSTIESARMKLQVFQDTVTGVDSLHKQKIEDENRRTIRDLFVQAQSCFERAHELDPKGLAALTGLFRCFKELKNEPEAQRVNWLIEEITAPQACQGGQDALGRDIPGGSYGPASDGSPSPDRPPVTASDLWKARDLFSLHRFDEALEELDRILNENPRLTQGFLLKARVHLEKHEFRPAERTIESALQADPTNEEVVQFKIDFQENLYNLLSRGADEFLKKGLALGPHFGNRFFDKAATCIEQALSINPGDILLLDHLYTCCMYLGRAQRALEVRKALYRLDPDVTPRYEIESHSAFCFLAGFAYGDQPAALTGFRALRRVMLRSALGGCWLNTWYFRLSPLLVSLFRTCGLPPSWIRVFLEPARRLGLRLHHRP